MSCMFLHLGQKTVSSGMIRTQSSMGFNILQKIIFIPFIIFERESHTVGVNTRNHINLFSNDFKK